MDSEMVVSYYWESTGFRMLEYDMERNFFNTYPYVHLIKCTCRKG